MAESRYSNWGRWGEGDERGALNLLTPEIVKGAAGLVHEGRIYSLGTAVGGDAAAGPGRPRPAIEVSHHNDASPGGSGGAEEVLTMNLHTSSHIDAFAHTWYDGRLYNGHPCDVVSAEGAARCGIGEVGAVAGRGILLDMPPLFETDCLDDGCAISPRDLDEAVRRQGVEIRAGDILLVRTGWQGRFRREGDSVLGSFPGLAATCWQWLAERDVAVLGADNGAVEVWPPEGKPLHHYLLRDFGIHLLEYLDLEELSADRVHEFFFVAAPLRIRGATASPVNPLAII